MLRFATGLIVVMIVCGASWTGYRKLTAAPTTTTQASVDPLQSDAAVRFQQGLPNHWRGYVLQKRW